MRLFTGLGSRGTVMAGWRGRLGSRQNVRMSENEEAGGGHSDFSQKNLLGWELLLGDKDSIIVFFGYKR